MSWITPKTDWHPSNEEGIAGADFNRIEGNIDYLKYVTDRSRDYHFDGEYSVPGSSSPEQTMKHQYFVILPPDKTLKLKFIDGAISHTSGGTPGTVQHIFRVVGVALGRLVSGDFDEYSPVATPAVVDSIASNSGITGFGFVQTGGLSQTGGSEVLLRTNPENIYREVVLIQVSIRRVVPASTTLGVYKGSIRLVID